ncbi:prolipoprotein diacylglyceryl transferase [Geobacter sp. SVR]|uniref:prolipoprotein diacylglyceryl transferase n=1 Tax=Geobacter sp. SVR TaxID=2495594 RepID=UPI00143EFD19|nr:prolipoprotein diacylglyceryl transferase [Geobacter sp. SVR]BCS54191.1 prolipoprotein diacylglyceryl transferase [Geobacter sp. SVR]GCF85950.1 prolipoprotein diacylglyceryl transferase [Geobacter sp. SVR]
MQFPSIDPVFLRIGPLQFRWYGLMYILGFIATYFILRGESARKRLSLSRDDIADLVFYGAMGVVLGGRLGYILFYNLGFYLTHPLRVFAVWEGGMSFHGGFLGVILAFVLFSRRRKVPFWTLIDMAALCAPVGLGLGRLGNFINGELYGRPTDVPWGMVFPNGGSQPRHPSQLYEAFLEGLVLFLIVRFAGRRSARTGVAAWSFVAGYGLFRFIIEFFREPDAQLGIFWGYLSMGQLLSLPMFLLGTFMVFRISRSNP